MSMRVSCYIGDMTSMIIRLQKQLDNITGLSNISDVMGKIGEYDSEMKKIYGKIEKHDDEISQLNKKVEDIKTQGYTKKGDLLLLVNEIELLKLELDTLKNSKTVFIEKDKDKHEDKHEDKVIDIIIEEKIKNHSNRLDLITNQIKSLTDMLNTTDEQLGKQIDEIDEKVVNVEKTVNNVNEEVTLQKKIIDELTSQIVQLKKDTEVQKVQSVGGLTHEIHTSATMIYTEPSAINMNVQMNTAFIPIESKVITGENMLYSLITIKNNKKVRKTFSIRITPVIRKFSLLSCENEYLFVEFVDDGVYMWGAGDFSNDWFLEEIITFFN